MKKIDNRNIIFKKAVSALLTVCLCASMASCHTDPTISSEPETSTTVTTTSETTTVTTTSETTTETTETEPAGPDFSKETAYWIFSGTKDSMTIYMNVNIDDYITTDEDGQEVFELYRLASDLGWLEKGVYSYDDYKAAMEANPDQTKIGHSNWFEYKYGDHRAVFTISEYIEDIEKFKSRQVSWISFEYLKNDFGIAYFDDASSNYGHGKVLFGFKKHYDKLRYRVSGQNCVCSRDDAIIIAYGLWFFTVNPDDCTAYREAFSKFNTKKGIQIS